MSPAPGNDASGEETPKGPRRSRRRLGCVQSSQCGSGSGEPRVVWDCQSPDQILATTAASGAATSRPGRRLSPGKLTDQLDPADGAKSCVQPETPPLVRIWLRERKTAATELPDSGAEVPDQEERDARMRSPLRSLNGPARKLRRAIAASAVDRSKAAPAAAAGCTASMSSASDSAADAELFGKLAAVVCAQRHGVSVPVSSSPSKSPNKYPVGDSPDASFVIPLIEDMPGWSDQSGFGEASFSTAIAESGSSPALQRAAARSVSSCTMRVRRLQAPSFPAAMDVDCSPRASTSAGCHVAAVRSAVDRDAVVIGVSHATASADSMVVDGGSRSKIVGTSAAATKVAFSRTVSAAAAASPRVPVSAHHAVLRRSPRLLTVVGSSDQRLQLRASNDLVTPASIDVGQTAATAASATASADAASVFSASGGVRRQLCLLTASSGTMLQSAAAAASEASTAASSAVPRAPTVPSASAVGSVAPKQTTCASTALPRPITVLASVDVPMSCQVATTLPVHVQGLPRGVQSRPAVAPAKLVNLWDSRHRSSVVLGKSATSSVTVAELQNPTVAGGQHGAGISVGVSNAGSQGSNGTGARCSSEEIARKKQEALERRMRKAAAVVSATAPTKGNEKEAICSLPAAGVERATSVIEALTSVTVQAVGTSTGLAGSNGYCTTTAAVISVATADACATSGTAGTSVTSADAASTGGSSQGQTRCSSEEIARKRQLALERKMKRAAVSAMQQSGSAAPIGRNGLSDVRVIAKGP